MNYGTTATERRGVFRIRVVGALLDVEIDGAPGALLDANSEGCGVRVKTPLPNGKRVLVAFIFEGVTYRGCAEVRNARSLASGGYRCGLQTCDGEQQLRRGLRKVAVETQRAQLRRRAQRR